MFQNGSNGRASDGPSDSFLQALQDLTNSSNSPAHASKAHRPGPPTEVVVPLTKQNAEDITVDFGRVKMLATREITLVLRNPGPADATVTLARLPIARGFTLLGSASDPGAFEGLPGEARVPSGMELRVGLAWTPTEVGPVRDVAEIAWPAARVKIQVRLKGHALESEGPLKKRAAKMPPARLDLKKPALHGGMASRGGAAGPAPAAAPGRAPVGPMEAATFRHVAEGAWAARQERCLTEWCNHVLGPSAGEVSPGPRERARALGVLWGLRRRDEAVKEAMLRIESEVDRGRFAMNEDLSAVADVSLRDRALAVMKELHPFWLQAGLEAVLGGSVAAGPGGRPLARSATEAELAECIKGRFLSDRELERQHLGGAGPDGVRTAAFRAAMGSLLLKRALLMAKLLDAAHTHAEAAAAAAPPPGGQPLPLLFRRASQLKSTQAWLAALLSGSLQGEGDLARHLSLVGFRLAYRQDPLAEMDLGVANLAVDLRDGARLCRLTEVLTAAPALSLVSKCRLPAAARAAKEHNLGLALAALERAGVSMDGVGRGGARVLPADLADGLRDRTLGLLWRLCVHFQVARAAPEAQLRLEVGRLAKKARHRSHWLEGLGDTPRGQLALGAGAGEPMADLLMRWAQAAGAVEGIRIGADPGSAFSDGSALCLLLAQYRPHLIERRRVWVPPYLRPPAAEDAEWGDGMRSGSTVAAHAPSKDFRRGAASNLRLLRAAAATVGPVPGLPPDSDLPGAAGEDPRAALALLALLASRVLAATREERAALVLQRWWRVMLLSRAPWIIRDLRARWVDAATRIQRAWRAHKLRQGLARGAEVRAGLQAAVAKLQATWKARRQRAAYLAERAGVVKVQAMARGFLARRELHSEHVVKGVLAEGLRRRRLLVLRRWVGCIEPIVTRAQARWRGRKQRQAFLRIKAAAGVIQAAVRVFLERRRQQRRDAAAAIIQRAWRAILAARRGSEEGRLAAAREAAALRIQAAWRGHVARRECSAAVRGVVRLQAVGRGFLARRYVASMRETWGEEQAVAQWWRARHAAATKIRARWLAFRARKAFRKAAAAATVIQGAWRRLVSRRAAARELEAQLEQVRAGLEQLEAAEEGPSAAADIMVLSDASAADRQEAAAPGPSSAPLLVEEFMARQAVGQAAAFSDDQRRGALAMRLRRHIAARTIQRAWRAVVALREAAALYEAEEAWTRALKGEGRGREQPAAASPSAGAMDSPQAQAQVQQPAETVAGGGDRPMEVDGGSEQPLPDRQDAGMLEAATAQGAVDASAPPPAAQHEGCAARTPAPEPAAPEPAAQPSPPPPLLDNLAAGVPSQGEPPAEVAAAPWQDASAADQDLFDLETEPGLMGSSDTAALEALGALRLDSGEITPAMLEEAAGEATAPLQAAEAAAAGGPQEAAAVVILEAGVAREAMAPAADSGPALSDAVPSGAEAPAPAAPYIEADSFDLTEVEEGAAGAGAAPEAGIMGAEGPGHTADLSFEFDAMPAPERAAEEGEAGPAQFSSPGPLTGPAAPPATAPNVWGSAEAAAALRIQRVYRGFLARRRAGPEVAASRARLTAAAQRAAANAGLRVGSRAAAALDRLLGAWSDPAECEPALQTLRVCTETLAPSVDALVARGGLVAIVRLMRDCHRTDEHMRVLQLCFCILDNVCSGRGGQGGRYIGRLLHHTDCLDVVCELLQRFRDKEAVFSGAALLFYHLCSRRAHARHVAADRAAVRTVAGLLDLLGRKYERDKVFIVGLGARIARSRRPGLSEIAAKALIVGKQLDLLGAVHKSMEKASREKTPLPDTDSGGQTTSSSSGGGPPPPPGGGAGGAGSSDSGAHMDVDPTPGPSAASALAPEAGREAGPAPRQAAAPTRGAEASGPMRTTLRPNVPPPPLFSGLPSTQQTQKTPGKQASLTPIKAGPSPIARIGGSSLPADRASSLQHLTGTARVPQQPQQQVTAVPAHQPIIHKPAAAAPSDTAKETPRAARAAPQATPGSTTPGGSDPDVRAAMRHVKRNLHLGLYSGSWQWGGSAAAAAQAQQQQTQGQHGAPAAPAPAPAPAAPRAAASGSAGVPSAPATAKARTFRLGGSAPTSVAETAPAAAAAAAGQPAQAPAAAAQPAAPSRTFRLGGSSSAVSGAGASGAAAAAATGAARGTGTGSASASAGSKPGTASGSHGKAGSGSGWKPTGSGTSDSMGSKSLSSRAPSSAGSTGSQRTTPGGGASRGPQGTGGAKQ